MTNVLLGWELGGGLGHVNRLLYLARRLEKSGLTPVLALVNLMEIAPLLIGEPYRLLPSPRWAWKGPRDESGFANSFADILANGAFGDPQALQIIVRAWESLIDLSNAQIVVCDHSPGLCLAARDRVPTVVIGNGYSVPPISESFPALYAGQPPTGAEPRVLENIREVQMTRSGSLTNHLPEYFAGNSRFPLTFPELDPYRATRQEPAFGPLAGSGPRLPRASGTRLFAYLASSYAWTESILVGLARCGLELSAYVRGASAELCAKLRSAGIFVYDKPPCLIDALRESAAIMHHAGVGTAETALAAGRPQIVLPRHQEQHLTASALDQLGVALQPQGRLSGRHFAAIARQALEDPSLHHRSMQIAEDIQHRYSGDPAEQIVRSCLELRRARDHRLAPSPE